MGLCKTSNFPIFTFINASDLKFCTRSYSSCVYHMMRFKGLNGKVCKMMKSHFRTLLCLFIDLVLGGVQVLGPCLTHLHSLPLLLKTPCIQLTVSEFIET